MASFDLAFPKTMKNEGGYSFDPADAGGETYCGISRKLFPSWGGWAIIDAIKAKKEPFNAALKVDTNLPALVKGFYKVNFWDRIGGDELPYQELSEELFDDAVNMGVTAAGKFLQEAVNLLNRGATNYQDVAVDGNLGAGTMAAVKSLVATDGDKALRYLMLVVNGLQREYYFNICRRNPGQEKFLRGWLERTA